MKRLDESLWFCRLDKGHDDVTKLLRKLQPRAENLLQIRRQQWRRRGPFSDKPVTKKFRATSVGEHRKFSHFFDSAVSKTSGAAIDCCNYSQLRFDHAAIP